MRNARARCKVRAHCQLRVAGVVLSAIGLGAGCRSSHNVGVDMQEGPPATQGTTEAARRQIVARSHVWDAEQHDRLTSLTPAQIKDGLQGDESFTFNQAVTCRLRRAHLEERRGRHDAEVSVRRRNARAAVPGMHRPAKGTEGQIRRHTQTPIPRSMQR